MKTLLLLLLSIMIAYGQSSMMDKINQDLDKILYEESHKPTINLDIKYDPFYHDKKEVIKKVTKTTPHRIEKKVKKPLHLSMIFNKKAFINGAWYRENQKVEQYLLLEVNQDSAILKQKNKIIVLKLKTTKNLLVKKEVL